MLSKGIIGRWYMSVKGKVIVCDFFKRLFIYMKKYIKSLNSKNSTTCDFTIDILLVDFIFLYYKG